MITDILSYMSDKISSLILRRCSEVPLLMLFARRHNPEGQHSDESSELLIVNLDILKVSNSIPLKFRHRHNVYVSVQVHGVGLFLYIELGHIE